MLKQLFKHQIVLFAGLVLYLVVGISIVSNTTVQMVPSLEQRNVTVTTYWSGATPQDIEKSILMEQEKYLSSLPNLLKMTSNAQVGQGEIILEFPFGTDIKHQMINISNALGQVPDYPENVDAPKVIGNTFANEPFMYFSLIPLAGNPLNIDMLNMKDFAQDVVRPQLERVEGISQVGVSGGEEKQIQIELDPYRLAQRGLTVTDIREKIRQRNRDMSVGDTENHQGRFFIRTTGRFTSIEELKALVVKSVDGSIVRLEDVASVRLGNFEHRKLAYFDAESNITLSMYRNLGTNVIDIKHRVLETVVSLNKQLESAGLRVEIIGDDVKYVQSSLKKCMGEPDDRRNSGYCYFICIFAYSFVVCHWLCRYSDLYLGGLLGIAPIWSYNQCYFISWCSICNWNGSR